ncbi:MAG: nucleotidyltransferase domain-containing protein [Chloroflexi bacterium]|nr:nucleotidyltransferase domain-containing protein [Chloroflexota bacterium]
MRLEEVLRTIRERREETAGFGVASLSVFDSMARGEAGPDGDVDILVEFRVPVGLFKFVRPNAHPLNPLPGIR